MAEQRDNKDILKEVCHLSRQNMFGPARQLILQAAGITPEERAKIPVGQMGKYILNKCKNPNIQRMIFVEKAFYDLWAMGKRDIDSDPSVSEASKCIEQLENVMPFLSKEDKLYAKYWQSYYYRYAKPDDDKCRYDLLMEVMQKTPKGNSESDTMFSDCSGIIFNLSIPLANKYKGIKLAQQKTTPEHFAHEHYKKMLSLIVPDYYDELLKTASSPEESYDARKGSYLTALNVVGDMDLSEERKNARKLYIYGQLIPLQQQYNDPDRFELYKKQQTLIYKQARLQKALGIYKYKAFDPYR